MLTLDNIYRAAFVLKDVARRTDLLHTERLSKKANIYLKTENLQVTGSFKVRGAYYKISQLTEAQRKAGIVACSAGNHAQGVALAATKMGIHSTVCMPDGAPISKVEATRRLGAEVCLVKGGYDDALILEFGEMGSRSFSAGLPTWSPSCISHAKRERALGHAPLFVSRRTPVGRRLMRVATVPGCPGAPAGPSGR